MIAVVVSSVVWLGPDPEEVMIDLLQSRIAEYHIAHQRRVRSVAQVGSKLQYSEFRATLIGIRGSLLKGNVVQYTCAVRYGDALHEIKTSVPLGNTDSIWYDRRKKTGDAFPDDTNRRHLFAFALDEFHTAHRDVWVMASKILRRHPKEDAAVLTMDLAHDPPALRRKKWPAIGDLIENDPVI